MTITSSIVKSGVSSGWIPCFLARNLTYVSQSIIGIPFFEFRTIKIPIISSNRASFIKVYKCFWNSAFCHFSYFDYLFPFPRLLLDCNFIDTLKQCIHINIFVFILVTVQNKAYQKDHLGYRSKLWSIELKVPIEYIYALNEGPSSSPQWRLLSHFLIQIFTTESAVMTYIFYCEGLLILVCWTNPVENSDS